MVGGRKTSPTHLQARDPLPGSARSPLHKSPSRARPLPFPPTPQPPRARGSLFVPGLPQASCEPTRDPKRRDHDAHRVVGNLAAHLRVLAVPGRDGLATRSGRSRAGNELPNLTNLFAQVRPYSGGGRESNLPSGGRRWGLPGGSGGRVSAASGLAGPPERFLAEAKVQAYEPGRRRSDPVGNGEILGKTTFLHPACSVRRFEPGQRLEHICATSTIATRSGVPVAHTTCLRPADPVRPSPQREVGGRRTGIGRCGGVGCS